MKKNKLIEILNSIEGNPEIKLWNGVVEDWADIDPNMIESLLVKERFDLYIEGVRLESAERSGISFDEYELSEEAMTGLKASYKKYIKWEENQFVYGDNLKIITRSGLFIFNLKSKMKPLGIGQGIFNIKGTGNDHFKRTS